jgi:DNA-binding response OmpR family regulator
MTRILIIEDDTNIRSEVTQLLQLEGFIVLVAANGEEGVRLAAEHLPDLVICDIMMPIMDGYTVLQSLRGNLLTATIPFIFLTAMQDHGDIRKGMETGADDYLVKPFTTDELLNAIHSQLTRQSQQNLEAIRQLALHLIELQ